ncbi:MAG: hypothetical protein ACRDAO_03675 [Culicoidibacterales bacterium]
MKKIIIIIISVLVVSIIIMHSLQSRLEADLPITTLATHVNTKELVPVSNTSLVDSLTQVIPKAKKLLKSKGSHLVTLPSLASAINIATGPAGLAMSAASIVIEYQFDKINSKLDTLSVQLNEISDFQNREFKSRIVSLHIKVKDTAKFSNEILNNEDVRLRKLSVLEALQSECTQLLQQINITIEEEITQNTVADFEAYSALTNDFHILTEQQQGLIAILNIISELTYLFDLGDVSYEMCYSIFETYYEQAVAVRTTLATWHQQHITDFGIDLENNRFDKRGLAAILSKVPGIFNDDWNYESLTQTLSEQIINQTALQPFSKLELTNSTHEELQIIIQDGAYYYQPAM